MSYTRNSKRRLCHTRKVFCDGFIREDGFYEIEGRMVDTKSHDIPQKNDKILFKGEALHDMYVLLVINENMVVQSSVAVTNSAPYEICKNANFKIENLNGLKIGTGWRKKITSSIGGCNGCTHIRELLMSMATVAFQTVNGEKTRLRRVAKNKGRSDPLPVDNSSPPLLNSCFAFDESSEVTKDLWPEYWVKKN